MAESLSLTTPITKPTQSTVQIERIVIDVKARSIYLQWLGNNDEAGSASYPTPAPAGSSQPSGQTLLSSLNTANLSTKSLVKRVIERLQTDGYLPAGTISGTPD